MVRAAFTIAPGKMLAVPGCLVLDVLADYGRCSHKPPAEHDPRRFPYLYRLHLAFGCRSSPHPARSASAGETRPACQTPVAAASVEPSQAISTVSAISLQGTTKLTSGLF